MLKEGTLVRHPSFGAGCVVHATFRLVWVYFPDVPGAVDDAVKKLEIETSRLVVDSSIKDPRLSYVPIKVVNGILEFPQATRMSHAEAVSYFLSKYPNGFKDKALIEKEIDYKRAAVRLFADSFGKGKGRALIARNRNDEIAARIVSLFQATNIPAVQEVIAIRDGVRDRARAKQFLACVLNFVDDRDARSFDALVDAVDSLPADLGKARVLTWPTVTMLPFLADPKRFIVLKPGMTKTAAERLFFDLAYDSRPNWTTFQRTLLFSESLRELMKPHGAKDFIDVQTFVWETAGAPAMKARRHKGSGSQQQT